MRILVDDSEVRKEATTESERARLAVEARALRAVAHPGVVQLLRVEGGDPPDTLVLRRVKNGALAALDAQPAEVIAGVAAAVATTIADLHDLCLAHGALDPSHILLDDEGRPVLCSFGRMSRDPRACAADSSALRTLIGALLPSPVPRPFRRAIAGRGGARLLARRLGRVPGARLPGGSAAPAAGVLGPEGCAADAQDRAWPALRRARPALRQARPALRQALRSRRVSPPAYGARAWATAALAGTAVLAVAAIALAVPLASDRRATQHPARRPATSVPPASPTNELAACPATDRGCAPIDAGSGVVDDNARFEVGLPGDVVAMGRWRCTPAALPAVLRVSTGQVWVFDRWASPQNPATGRLVGDVSGATFLAVLPGRNGCDRLAVSRPSEPSVVIDPMRS